MESNILHYQGIIELLHSVFEYLNASKDDDLLIAFLRRMEFNSEKWDRYWAGLLKMAVKRKQHEKYRSSNLQDLKCWDNILGNIGDIGAIVIRLWYQYHFYSDRDLMQCLITDMGNFWKIIIYHSSVAHKNYILDFFINRITELKDSKDETTTDETTIISEEKKSEQTKRILPTYFIRFMMKWITPLNSNKMNERLFFAIALHLARNSRDQNLVERFLVFLVDAMQGLENVKRKKKVLEGLEKEFGNTPGQNETKSKHEYIKKGKRLSSEHVLKCLSVNPKWMQIFVEKKQWIFDGTDEMWFEEMAFLNQCYALWKKSCPQTEQEIVKKGQTINTMGIPKELTLNILCQQIAREYNIIMSYSALYTLHFLQLWTKQENNKVNVKDWVSLFINGIRHYCSDEYKEKAINDKGISIEQYIDIIADICLQMYDGHKQWGEMFEVVYYPSVISNEKMGRVLWQISNKWSMIEYEIVKTKEYIKHLLFVYLDYTFGKVYNNSNNHKKTTMNDKKSLIMKNILPTILNLCGEGKKSVYRYWMKWLSILHIHDLNPDSLTEHVQRIVEEWWKQYILMEENETKNDDDWYYKHLENKEKWMSCICWKFAWKNHPKNNYAIADMKDYLYFHSEDISKLWIVHEWYVLRETKDVYLKDSNILKQILNDCIEKIRTYIKRKKSDKKKKEEKKIPWLLIAWCGVNSAQFGQVWVEKKMKTVRKWMKYMLRLTYKQHNNRINELMDTCVVNILEELRKRRKDKNSKLEPKILQKKEKKNAGGLYVACYLLKEEKIPKEKGIWCLQQCIQETKKKINCSTIKQKLMIDIIEYILGEKDTPTISEEWHSILYDSCVYILSMGSKSKKKIQSNLHLHVRLESLLEKILKNTSNVISYLSKYLPILQVDRCREYILNEYGTTIIHTVGLREACVRYCLEWCHKCTGLYKCLWYMIKKQDKTNPTEESWIQSIEHKILEELNLDTSDKQLMEKVKVHDELYWELLDELLKRKDDNDPQWKKIKNAIWNYAKQTDHSREYLVSCMSTCINKNKLKKWVPSDLEMLIQKFKYCNTGIIQLMNVLDEESMFVKWFYQINLKNSLQLKNKPVKYWLYLFAQTMNYYCQRQNGDDMKEKEREMIEWLFYIFGQGWVNFLLDCLLNLPELSMIILKRLEQLLYEWIILKTPPLLIVEWWYILNKIRTSIEFNSYNKKIWYIPKWFILYMKKSIRIICTELNHPLYLVIINSLLNCSDYGVFIFDQWDWCSSIIHEKGLTMEKTLFPMLAKIFVSKPENTHTSPPIQLISNFPAVVNNCCLLPYTKTYIEEGEVKLFVM